MRGYAQVSLMLVTLVACLPPGDDLWAKGGHGGSKGGGKSHKTGSSFHGHGGGKKLRGGAIYPVRKNSALAAKDEATKQVLNGSEEPWTKHHAREQRKLEHRQQVADHLREVSDRNGNEHLKQVADDMDERAQAHYDKQLEKINQKYGLDDTVPDADVPEDVAGNPPSDAGEALDDSGDFFNSTSKKLEELDGKLTGPENAAARQLRNEMRNLTRRMEAVERLRELAEETGNENMLKTADQLEQQALDQFHKRMEKIGEFRQRHGLPDIQHHFVP